MAESRTISRNCRRTRLRSTAPPTFLETVNPTRAGPSSPRWRSCTTKPAVGALAPAAAARKSFRCLSRSIAPTCGSRRGERSRTEPLAAARPAGIEHLSAARGGHPGPEAMTALAYQLARLIGPLHGFPRSGLFPGVFRPRGLINNSAARAAHCRFGRDIARLRRLIREGLSPVNARLVPVSCNTSLSSCLIKLKFKAGMREPSAARRTSYGMVVSWGNQQATRVWFTRFLLAAKFTRPGKFCWTAEYMMMSFATYSPRIVGSAVGWMWPSRHI